MAHTITDGFHEICGYTVMVKDGGIIRGIGGNGNNQHTIYPYRADKHGGWNECSGITVAAFRAGVKRGTIIMR